MGGGMGKISSSTKACGKWVETVMRNADQGRSVVKECKDLPYW